MIVVSTRNVFLVMEVPAAFGSIGDALGTSLGAQGPEGTPTPLNKKTVPTQEDPCNFLFHRGSREERVSFLILVFLYLVGAM